MLKADTHPREPLRTVAFAVERAVMTAMHLAKSFPKPRRPVQWMEKSYTGHSDCKLAWRDSYSTYQKRSGRAERLMKDAHYPILCLIMAGASNGYLHSDLESKTYPILPAFGHLQNLRKPS